jgi:hypothetical protein
VELEKQDIRPVMPVKAARALLYAFIKCPEFFEVLYSPKDDDSDIREIRLTNQSIIGTD